MSLDKNYQGTDANLEISLEEYGFVARPVKVDYEDEYFVIYKMGDNQYGSGHIRESELDAIVNGTEWASKEDVDSMLETVGSSKEEWMDLPFEYKFSDLVSYWGTENVIGSDYYPNDKKWAFEEIGLEFDSDDEFAKGGGVDITSLKKGDVITILGDSYKFLRYETENDEEKTVVLDLKDNSIVSMPKDMVEAYSKYKFAKGGGVDKELYEITLEDIFSFATQSKTTELTDAQYRSILEQKKNGDIVIDRYNQKQGIHEKLRIKSVTKKFAKGGGVRKRNGREYSYGRNWTNDHRHHNKSENYEIPMSNRKRKFADGGLSRDEAINKKFGIPNWDGAGVDGWYKSLIEVYANDSKKFLNKLKKKKNVDNDDVVELANLIGQDLTDGGNDFVDEDDFEWSDDSAMEVCYAVAEKWLKASDIKVIYEDGGDVFAKGGSNDKIFYTLGFSDIPTMYGVYQEWIDEKLKSMDVPVSNKTRLKLTNALHDRFVSDWENGVLGFSPDKKRAVFLEWDEDAQEGLEEQDADGNWVAKKGSKYISFTNKEWQNYFESISDDEDVFAKGGGVRKSLFGNREYSYGRNWTNDHRHHNKSENYEVPMSKRKRKYAEGGDIFDKGGLAKEKYMLLYDFVDEKMIEGDSDAESMINEKGYSLTYDELYDFVDGKMIEGDSDAENLLNKINSFEYAKGGGVRTSLFSNREYSYGRNWTNEHRHQNKSENYEVPMSKRKRKYAEGGDTGYSKKDRVIDYYYDEDVFDDYETYGLSEDDLNDKNKVVSAIIEYHGLDNSENVDERFENLFGDEDEDFAKGGGVRKVNGREYSYGRNWTNDHRHQNKREDYEVPMSKRKRKYAEGGDVEQNLEVGNIVELSESGWDNENYQDFFNGIDDVKLVVTNVYTSTSEHQGFDSGVGMALYSLERLDDGTEVPFDLYDYELEYVSQGETFAKGGGVRKVNGREYSYGRNWTNDHRHQNKREDYEVPMSKRKRKYAEGGVVYMEYEMDFYGDAEDFDDDGYAMSEGAEVINFQAENDEKAIEYATSNYSDIYSITNKKTKKVIYQDEDEDFAKGGGVRKVNGREYSYGRNWTNDHRHHNKRQNYEIPMSDRKRKYAEGGGVNEIKNYDNEDEVIEDALKYINNELNVNLNRDDFEKYMNFEDKVDFYKTKNNNPETFKKVQDVIEKLGEKLGDYFEGKDSLELEVRKDYYNVGSKMSVLMHIAHYTGRGNDRSTQNFLVFPKYPNKYNEVVGGLRFAEGGGVRTYNGREYSYGRNWTNDHRHHNKSEDYEVPMSDRKRKYADGGGAKGEMYKKFGDENSKLVNFDVDDLDMFETQQYNHFIKSMSKAEALQVLINGVESDYSQLSDKLSEIAEEQYPSDEWYEDNNDSFAKGGGVREKNGREYSYGRNWTNDHRHHNKSENYEVSMSNRKRKYADGGLAEMNEDTNLGYTLYHTYDTLKEAQDVVDKSRKESPEYNAIVTKSNNEERPYKVLMTTGLNMGKRVYADGGGVDDKKFFEVYDKKTNKTLLIKADSLESAKIYAEESIDFNDYEDGEKIDLFDWFWNYDYRHYLRDASAKQRSIVKQKFIEKGLKLDGSSPKHSYIVISTIKPSELKLFKKVGSDGIKFADGGGVDNFDWEELTYKQKLSLVRESGLKDVVANKSVGVLTSNELSKLKNSVRLNRETKTGKFAKGGMVEMLNNIKETNTISEKEIKLINRRLNAGNIDADTQELIDYIWDNTPVLTEEQGKKGYDYLMNVWKSPTGKTRVNNPFGYREQEVLENYSNFELAGFYKNRNSYIPIYNVIGNDTSFQYYLDGVVNIIGADGGMFAKGGGVRKKNGREYSYGRNWTNDHRHQNKREDYEVPMSDRKRKYADGGGVDNDYSFVGNLMMNGEYKFVFKKDDKYYIKNHNLYPKYSYLTDEKGISNYRIGKSFSDGGGIE